MTRSWVSPILRGRRPSLPVVLLLVVGTIVVGAFAALQSENLCKANRVGPVPALNGTDYFDVLLGLPPLIDCDRGPISLEVDPDRYATDPQYRLTCDRIAEQVRPHLEPGATYDVWIACSCNSLVAGWPFRSWQADERVTVEVCSIDKKQWSQFWIPIRADGRPARVYHLFVANSVVYSLLFGSFIAGTVIWWSKLRARQQRSGFPVVSPK